MQVVKIIVVVTKLYFFVFMVEPDLYILISYLAWTNTKKCYLFKIILHPIPCF